MGGALSSTSALTPQLASRTRGFRKRSLAGDPMISLIILQLGPVVYFLGVRGKERSRAFVLKAVWSNKI